jgi:hypothetical protein
MRFLDLGTTYTSHRVIVRSWCGTNDALFSFSRLPAIPVLCNCSLHASPPLSNAFSPLSVQCGGRVEIIANDQGHQTTPSWVAMSGCTFFSFVTRHLVSPKARIGDSAKNAFHPNPTNMVFDMMRLIGHKMDDPETQRNIKHWSACHFNQFLCLILTPDLGLSKLSIRMASSS